VFLKNELEEIGGIEGRKKRYPKRNAHKAKTHKKDFYENRKQTLSAEDKENSSKSRTCKRNLNLPMGPELMNQRVTKRNCMSVGKGGSEMMSPQFQFEDLPKQFNPNFNVPMQNYGHFAQYNGNYAQPQGYVMNQNPQFAQYGQSNQFCQQTQHAPQSQDPNYGFMVNSRIPAGYPTGNTAVYQHEDWNVMRQSSRMSRGSEPPMGKPPKARKLRIASVEGPSEPFHQFSHGGQKLCQYSNVQNFHTHGQNPQAGFMTMPNSPQNSLPQHPMAFNFYPQTANLNKYGMNYQEPAPKFETYGNNAPPGLTANPQPQETVVPQDESNANVQFPTTVAESLWQDGFAAGQLSQYVRSQSQVLPTEEICYPNATITESPHEFPETLNLPKTGSYPLDQNQYVHDLFCNCSQCLTAQCTTKDLNNEVYFTDNLSTTIDSTTQKPHGKSASNRSSNQPRDEQITEFTSEQISKDYQYEKSLDIIFAGTEYPIFTNI